MVRNVRPRAYHCHAFQYTGDYVNEASELFKFLKGRPKEFEKIALSFIQGIKKTMKITLGEGNDARINTYYLIPGDWLVKSIFPVHRKYVWRVEHLTQPEFDAKFVLSKLSPVEPELEEVEVNLGGS